LIENALALAAPSPMVASSSSTQRGLTYLHATHSASTWSARTAMAAAASTSSTALLSLSLLLMLLPLMILLLLLLLLFLSLLLLLLLLSDGEPPPTATKAAIALRSAVTSPSRAAASSGVAPSRACGD
jgi:hypothetical protein